MKPRHERKRQVSSLMHCLAFDGEGAFNQFADGFMAASQDNLMRLAGLYKYHTLMAAP